MPAVAPFIALGLLGIIAVLIGTSGESKAATKPQGKLPPQDDAQKALPPVTTEDKEFSQPVRDLIDKAEQTNDPAPLKEASEIAASEGKDAQAAALEKAYDGKRIESGGVTFTSPIANVKPEFWTRYVNCVKGDNPRIITPGFALGLFLFGARRLVDLGIMRNPRQGTYQGKTVWTGDWTGNLDINKFLADSALQYQVFFASMRDYAARIRDTPAVKALIGRQVDGVPITLSGILGVAHRAGWSGMQKWFSSPADRAKFTATTKAFQDCNGIF